MSQFDGTCDGLDNEKCQKLGFDGLLWIENNRELLRDVLQERPDIVPLWCHGMQQLSR